MLSVNDIKCSFGARILFNHVSFTLNPGDRAGLVGPNGTGKTTLLRIIAGQVEPESGRLAKPAQYVVEYLPQELSVDEFAGTVWDEASRAFEAVQTMADELDHVHGRLADMADLDEKEYEALLEKQHILSGFLEHAGFHQQDARTGRVLSGLGFSKEEFHKPLSEFSGGWKMRACLARILLSAPDILLLDEPTNHLDIDSVTWLEDWLMGHRGALLLVSHDEEFLNRLSMRIIALESGTAVIYQGNYHDYLEESRARRLHLEARERTRQARLRETERFIERFRYKATKARQVQSRIKMLEREKKVSPVSEGERCVSFRFPEPERSGRDVALGRHICKSYKNHDGDGTSGPDHVQVFRDLSFRIERGDHVAVVGPNGSGKSTLAKIIAGVIPYDSGVVELGYHVSVSYFGQHQARELPVEATVLEAMTQIPGGEVVQRVRDLLGAFLFSRDMMKSGISCLSGGEKSRLALARMLLNPSNFLVLDEPTNHLDIASKKVLKEALRQFAGSFVLVSHDRAFMQGIISKVWEVRAGVLTEHLGGMNSYFHAISNRSVHEADAAHAFSSGVAGMEETDNASGVSGRRLSAKELRRRAARKRELIRNKLGPLEEKYRQAEMEVQSLEEQKAALEARLSDPSAHADGVKMKKLNSDYKNVSHQLDEMYVLWEKTDEELGRARKKLKSS